MSTDLPRCFWVNPRNSLYVRYHDEEWGVPCHDERMLFEMLILEGFQAGLSWECVLNKREAFRKAFDGFDVQRIAQYTDRKLAELAANPSIIRNRQKIHASVANAHAYIRIQEEYGSFDRYIWSFTDGQVIYEPCDLRTTSPLSDTISSDLKKRGMKFVGSTIIYSYLQAIGIINGHLPGCHKYHEVGPRNCQIPGRRRTKESTSIYMKHIFENKIVVVTGGAQGIGKCIADEFRGEGATVCVIDKQPGDHYVGDIADKAVLEAFAVDVLSMYGHVDYIVNNALPIMRGITECTYEEFLYAQQVGVVAPFYLVKLFADHLGEGAAIVNISSSRDRMSQPETESYTAAKGGIAALTHALAVSLRGKARVNSVSPGWIDTAYTVYDGPDATQQPAGRVGNPMDIANMVLYLCSDKAGFITGENICIDGGMTHQMIYHGDCGWKLEEK